ncbi:MAG: hypothetical protein JSS36_08070 [Proteobacteria bacterium]|nr:hypothetical protein [Pseudomonadota bacterium]
MTDTTTTTPSPAPAAASASGATAAATEGSRTVLSATQAVGLAPAPAAGSTAAPAPAAAPAAPTAAAAPADQQRVALDFACTGLKIVPSTLNELPILDASSILSAAVASISGTNYAIQIRAGRVGGNVQKAAHVRIVTQPVGVAAAPAVIGQIQTVLARLRKPPVGGASAPTFAPASNGWTPPLYPVVADPPVPAAGNFYPKAAPVTYREIGTGIVRQIGVPLTVANDSFGSGAATCRTTFDIDLASVGSASFFNLAREFYTERTATMLNPASSAAKGASQAAGSSPDVGAFDFYMKLSDAFAAALGECSYVADGRPPVAIAAVASLTDLINSVILNAYADWYGSDGRAANGRFWRARRMTMKLIRGTVYLLCLNFLVRAYDDLICKPAAMAPYFNGDDGTNRRKAFSPLPQCLAIELLGRLEACQPGAAEIALFAIEQYKSQIWTAIASARLPAYLITRNPSQGGGGFSLGNPLNEADPPGPPSMTERAVARFADEAFEEIGGDPMIEATMDYLKSLNGADTLATQLDSYLDALKADKASLLTAMRKLGRADLTNVLKAPNYQAWSYGTLSSEMTFQLVCEDRRSIGLACETGHPGNLVNRGLRLEVDDGATLPNPVALAAAFRQIAMLWPTGAVKRVAWVPPLVPGSSAL